MAKVELTEGILDRFMKNVEKRVQKMKEKNVDKLLKSSKFKRELNDFAKSLGSLEDLYNEI
jgi:hypothetical protein|tara:strand:- start:494 stop:676 length:183 start_codon:yes stop_codon:yes gene_type:complete